MTVFKCDICGFYYDGYYDGTLDSSQCNTIAICFRCINGFIRESKNYDICPNCLTAFSQFLYDRRHLPAKKVIDQEKWRGE